MKCKLKFALLIAVFASLFLMTGCAFLDLSDGCGNEVLQEISSPDKQHKIVIFERDCGATTDFSTQISIFPQHKILANEAGNIFTCDSDRGKAPAGPGGGPPVEVNWQGDGVLEIVHDTDARVHFASKQFDQIKIVYRKKDF